MRAPRTGAFPLALLVGVTTGALLSQLLPAPEELGGPAVSLPAAQDRVPLDLPPVPGPSLPVPAPGAPPAAADPGAVAPTAPADAGAGPPAPPADPSAPPSAPAAPAAPHDRTRPGREPALGLVSAEVQP
ncbi:hypothetical protein ACFVFS_40445, partial [Kitasatospora sp. NPDC057692]